MFMERKEKKKDEASEDDKVGSETETRKIEGGRWKRGII